MGAALYIHKPPNKEMLEYVIVAGMTELRQLWFPIMQERKLALLDACFTGGLTLDDALYQDALAEVEVMCAEIERREEPTDFDNSALHRCRRLRDALVAHPPDAGWELYLG